ncbi:hypothetical protein ANO14919_040970 [Xylariales sp. No.14919]|nr:hypothetical protein ANO14919_040970 [Xylariales sp. No.14919]
MLPEYRQIRETETAKYWIKDTMEIRYGELMMIRECSGKRGAKARAFHSKSQLGQGSKASQGKQASKHLPDLAPLRPSMPSIARVEPDEPVPEGYVALWKGVARCRIKFLLDGQLNIQALESLPPCDFHGTSSEGPVLYFAEDRAVRQQYAHFALQRQSQSSSQVGEKGVVLLRLLVNKAWAEGIRQYIEGDDWKKVIFLCRKGRDLRANRRTGFWGRELGGDGYADEKVLVGHISQG